MLQRNSSFTACDDCLLTSPGEGSGSFFCKKGAKVRGRKKMERVQREWGAVPR